jgi:hypothetical protein|tara:strand:+ start:180 stop:500 length:321 start_codon:yes stop_codon:yes gene_type:complete
VRFIKIAFGPSIEIKRFQVYHINGMTVNKFYSLSIRPKGIAMDFSRRDKLLGELSDYCLSIQYIEVHMNEVEAYQKAELKLEIDGENLDNVREILKPFGLEKQLLD